MMNKKQTSKLSIFKYALLVPVIGALVFFYGTLKLEAGTAGTTGAIPGGQTVVIRETVKQNEGSVTYQTIMRDTVQHTLVIEEKTVFTHIEVMPSFPGGDKAMMQWLSDNLQYPKTALEKGIEGRVIVRFIVGADGSISGAEIQRSLDPACDAEAIRVVGKMPKWIPGKQGGEPVAVYYTVPILFKLQDKNAKKKDK